MAPIERSFYINGKKFVDVTGQTVSGPTYTMRECREIAYHGHVINRVVRSEKPERG